MKMFNCCCSSMPAPELWKETINGRDLLFITSIMPIGIFTNIYIVYIEDIETGFSHKDDSQCGKYVALWKTFNGFSNHMKLINVEFTDRPNKLKE